MSSDLINSLLSIGFENEPNIEFKRNSWYDENRTSIYNVPNTAYINITTTIPEFMVLCEKLENLKTQMAANMILFNIFLRFSELPSYVVFECSYIGVVGYRRFYKLPYYASMLPCIKEYHLNIIYPTFLTKSWIKNFVKVIRCLQLCNVINFSVEYNDNNDTDIEDPFEYSVLPNGINFDDVKNAVRLEKFEKLYGNDMGGLPVDIRNKIYSMVTPVCKEFGNTSVDKVESYDLCKLQYECVNT